MSVPDPFNGYQNQWQFSDRKVKHDISQQSYNFGHYVNIFGLKPFIV